VPPRRPLGDVQLGAVDGAHFHRDPLVAHELDQALAGHALEEVIADRRGQRHAVADHEDVRRARLVDVAVGGQDHGLVVAVEFRLGLLERHVDVAADDLAARRQGFVGVAPP
jgi:hypothetical protein